MNPGWKRLANARRANKILVSKIFCIGDENGAVDHPEAFNKVPTKLAPVVADPAMVGAKPAINLARSIAK
jgi:hypothetical protein